MYQTFATRIVSLVGDAITADSIDQNAFTEWLTEEAMNAIDIMNPEMLISASDSLGNTFLMYAFNSVCVIF